LSHRRLPKHLAKNHAEVLLKIIEDSSATAGTSPPRHIRRDTPEARQAQWLQLLVISFCAHHKLAPRLLLPQKTCEDLVLHRPTTPSGITDLIGPWRFELIGQLILDAFSGSVAIVLESGDVGIVSR
jgi:ribonuclease D